MGYQGPNGIPKDVIEREWMLISVVRCLEPEYEIVTRGRLYNFDVLNIPITGHRGKRIINPNW